MCLGRPSRVVRVESGVALVETDGRAAKVATLLVPDIAPGEDVLVAGGLIVARIPPDEAQARRQLFGQMLELAADQPSAERAPGSS